MSLTDIFSLTQDRSQWRAVATTADYAYLTDGLNVLTDAIHSARYSHCRMSVRPSVILVYCIEMDKDIIKLFRGLVAPITLGFPYHIILWLRNCNGQESLSLE